MQPLTTPRKTHSGSQLPVIYTGVDNTPIVNAVVRELDHYDADIHYLRVNVTLDFVRARGHRFHQVYFEIAQKLADEQSGYRLLDYYIKQKSTHTYQITFMCRYIGIADFATLNTVKPSLIKRFMRLVS